MCKPAELLFPVFNVSSTLLSERDGLKFLDSCQLLAGFSFDVDFWQALFLQFADLRSFKVPCLDLLPTNVSLFDVTASVSITSSSVALSVRYGGRLADEWCGVQQSDTECWESLLELHDVTCPDTGPVLSPVQVPRTVPTLLTVSVVDVSLHTDVYAWNWLKNWLPAKMATIFCRQSE